MLHLLAGAGEAPTVPQPMLYDNSARSHRDIAGPLLSSRTIVFHEGFARSPIYRVVDGCVATFQTLADGRRQIIDLVGPGRLIGLGASEYNRHSAETLGFTRLELLSAPLVANQFESALTETLARSQALAMLLGRKTAPERLASALLDLAEQFGRPARERKRGAVTFHLYPTRGDLADWLGLTLETVSRCLTRLKKADLIDIQRGDLVTLLDPRQLAHIAVGDQTLSH
ncbi:helix-turn-helix domain-containing protein [Peteryoungia desertarenae]|uniref:Helix-turn-helix domain-containing protein n=1 Tax=Peteryoungia desertarenae TaxID=1813451 RepID=A0ABX6QK27_9HYPH|nr:helix-turn-helix domain-containing protein [Peteryoungia desertarenae]QLF68908.1 helix-turn-helix domain-containing protein [Peteryoungia desertarenae]